jgi:hypothetical protein
MRTSERALRSLAKGMGASERTLRVPEKGMRFPERALGGSEKGRKFPERGLGISAKTREVAEREKEVTERQGGTPASPARLLLSGRVRCRRGVQPLSDVCGGSAEC